MLMNLRVPKNAGKISSGFTTGGISSSAQLHMFLWSRAQPVRSADNLTAICEPIA
jgi:hypothetical protein